MADERVVLNVGGQRFEASLATLTKYPDSLLGHMFSEENRDSLKPDDKGEYFFDRNGRLFEFILDFHRTGEFHIPAGVSREKVRSEAEFWGLDPDLVGADDDDDNAHDDSDAANKSQGDVDDSDESEDEAPAPVRAKASRAASKKVSLATGVSVEEAVAFSKLPMQQRCAKAIDLVHQRERGEILKGVAFLTNVCDELKEDPQSAALKADSFYYLAFGCYRLGLVPRAKRALETVTKVEPNSVRVKDLQTLLEDSGASRAKSGFVFVAVVAVGIAVTWRLLSRRGGSSNTAQVSVSTSAQQ